MAGAAATGTRTEAYVTVLPPADADAVIGRVGRLVAARATGFGLYHLRLAPRWRQRTLAEIVEAVRG